MDPDLCTLWNSEPSMSTAELWAQTELKCFYAEMESIPRGPEPVQVLGYQESTTVSL